MAVEICFELFAHGVNVARFGLEQTAGADILCDFCFGAGDVIVKCGETRKQCRCDEIDAGVCALCGQACGDEQLEWIGVDECAGGIRIFCFECLDGSQGALLFGHGSIRPFFVENKIKIGFFFILAYFLQRSKRFVDCVFWGGRV